MIMRIWKKLMKIKCWLKKTIAEDRGIKITGHVWDEKHLDKAVAKCRYCGTKWEG